MKIIDYEKEHRKLWCWLADHPKAKKDDYFKNWDYDDEPYNLCFACEVALQEADRTYTADHCQFCPLGGERIVGCTVGLYTKWAYAASLQNRRRLARKIANLPWKEKEGVK